jgi:allantoin racemase
MRRILVINPNTSRSMTEDIKRSAERCAWPGTELSFTNPQEGLAVIETNLDDSISAIGALEIVAQERDQYDAFVIAASPDPGMFALREVTDKPVVGIGQSPLLLASLLGRRFSILGHWLGDKPRSEDKAEKYKLDHLLASVIPCGVSPLNIHGNHESRLDQLISLGRTAIEQDGAEVLVLTGAAFAGMHLELSERLGVPVLEGIACAIKLAEILVDLGLRTTRVGQYQLPTNRNPSDPLTH